MSDLTPSTLSYNSDLQFLSRCPCMDVRFVGFPSLHGNRELWLLYLEEHGLFFYKSHFCSHMTAKKKVSL